ncbi:GntT/GntP/DsdX family permease [Paraburkholderia bannensis]|uniref:GntT/GntP/DsdX family permease n=1 Tax=Paraburkholderia bannensis TaxID=765414 RepID=UPI002AC333A9|nr:gluconate:H+ symporter [Paraburkholderia bannensis]
MLSPSSTLIALLVFSIALLVVLIVRLKVHASIALIFVAVALALATHMPLNKLVSTVEGGIGGTLSFLAMVMAFGAILGKMLDDSGGAQQIAQTLLRCFGTNNAPWVMAVIGFVVGIPVFSDVGFLLMAPLVAVVAKNANMSKMRVGVPLLVSLHVIHCIVPPHPAATAVTNILGADVGSVILAGILIGIPCAATGAAYICYITRKERHAALTDEVESLDKNLGNQELPGFGITLFTVLLPLLIMVGKTILQGFFPPGTQGRNIVDFLGDPFTALLLSVCFAYWSLGLSRGSGLEKLSYLTGESYRQIANVMLIIGCGGALNAVISASGIADVLASALTALPISPILLAWLLTGLLHLAVGSATVAMLGAAGIIAPMLHANPALHPVAMTLAIGSGAIGFVQFTDSLIWLGKEYLSLSMGNALRSISVATMLASILGLGGALLANLVL